MSGAPLWLYGEQPAKIMQLPGTLAWSLGFLEKNVLAGSDYGYFSKHVILSLASECLMHSQQETPYTLSLMVQTIVVYVNGKGIYLINL